MEDGEGVDHLRETKNKKESLIDTLHVGLGQTADRSAKLLVIHGHQNVDRDV
ncbi:hypothetical protein GCM10008023_24510 [Sphingomonas glacialis]|uniref:Uncharacterized protein n=1 Tax=Sphingomonas glacialis TaxID=658225 RepID=A0ABQ3LMH6_9SPHN|nr:hypothetical protein GCM10008023_24510 [Sphingomonas glacialis]